MIKENPADMGLEEKALYTENRGGAADDKQPLEEDTENPVGTADDKRCSEKDTENPAGTADDKRCSKEDTEKSGCAEISSDTPAEKDKTGFEGNSYDKEEPKEKQEKRSLGAELYGWLETVIQSVAAALLLVVFVANISMVSGSSMEPTLKENDRLLVLQGFYQPRYGDIVALWADNLFNGETGKQGELIVKRIIGLPGDEIDINAVSGVVYRNGEPLREDYIRETINPDCLGNIHYPVRVEENCVFVLGDNRNHSTDSRYGKNDNTPYYVGNVDMRYIVGKAVYRIYPLDRIGVLE